MQDTPKGLRLHIGLFGKRNSGKSTLMNALIGQSVSIVSAHPGTTTDPVEKAYELAPLGAVVFIDTAGLDDVGELGALRVERRCRCSKGQQAQSSFRKCAHVSVSLFYHFYRA